MDGSAIPRVINKQPGPQPPPEISHYDFAGVNCKQKKAWRPLDGDVGSADLFRGGPSFQFRIMTQSRRIPAVTCIKLTP